MITETPFYLPHSGYNLFAFLHEPSSVSIRGSIIFCHPFGEEKLWSHRVYVNFARALAKIGYTVMRFDFMGHGDSDGHFSDASIETRLSDTLAALKWLKDNKNTTNGICLLGLRLGASIACLAANQNPVINRLILWDPIINGGQYMKQLMRINLSTQSAVFKEIRYDTKALVEQLRQGQNINIDGYEIAYPFYEQMLQIDLMSTAPKTNVPTLVVGIMKNVSNRPTKHVAFANQLPNGTYKEVIEEPFWKEIKRYYAKAPHLFDQTLKWLEDKSP